MSLGLTTANLAVSAAVEAAKVTGGKFCIAIMDAGVNMVAFSRMDGARIGTIDVAMKKVILESQSRIMCGCVEN